MFSSKMFANNAVVSLRNGTKVHASIVDPIMNAIRSLIKKSYTEYAEFVEFCEGYESLIPEKISYDLADLERWLDISSIGDVSFDDVINVVLSAVDNDMVIGSPFPRKAQQMYARCTTSF